MDPLDESNECVEIAEKIATAASRVIGYRMWVEGEMFSTLAEIEITQANAYMQIYCLLNSSQDTETRLKELLSYWEQRFSELPASYRDGNPESSFPRAPGLAAGKPLKSAGTDSGG